MCAMGVKMANDLFLSGHSMWLRLRSLDFFQPMIELMDEPVLVVDTCGRILIANRQMESYLPGFNKFPYGEQLVSAYFSKKSSIQSILNDPISEHKTIPVFFQESIRKPIKELDCKYRTTIQFKNGMRFIVLVFQNPKKTSSKKKNKKPAKVIEGVSIHDSTVDYIGSSAAWQRVDNIVNRIAPINVNTLILGETGTGKEMVARAIHRRSGRKGNFVAINCGAVPRELFAAELFGYESGAFTGAREEGSIGKIEAANHGTLLLDEIGEMPLELQVGLLRTIQDQAVTRLGSTESHPLDIRVLAATNEDIRGMIKGRTFRPDLYYRLSTIEIHLPPLRERDGDIDLLAEYFNHQISDSLGLTYSPLSKIALDSFRHYSWPGNVRELRNVVERCLIVAGEGEKVTEKDLPIYIVNSRSKGHSFFPASSQMPLSERLMSVDEGANGEGDPVTEEASHLSTFLSGEEKADRKHIADLLVQNDGNVSKVSDVLHVSRTTLYKRMKRYHLKVKVVVETDEGEKDV